MQDKAFESRLTSDSAPFQVYEGTLTLGQIVVVSPHLDDAVFSCGDLIAGCDSPLVLTVFAGTPPDDGSPTPWDAACGFSSASQAMQRRKSEDVQATSMLGARSLHLPFLDSQYGYTPDIQDIVAAVRDALLREQADTVFFPLGLFHSDHVLLHYAMLVLRDHEPALRWIAYEDAFYRRKPHLLERRLKRLHEAGAIAKPFCQDATESPRFSLQKQAAVARYKSQLHGVGLTSELLADPRRRNSAADNDTVAPEGYWLLC